ncbi:protein peste-like isoform X2 [Rhodnius prolixus]
MNPNGTVTFKISRKWFFDKESSNGTLDDIVTTLNAVAMSAATTAKDWSRLMTSPLSIAMIQTGQKIYIQKKVGDLLFFGYKDPLLDIADSLPKFIGVDIPFDKFGWFYKRNESSDFEGVFNMNTGVNDIYQLGRLHNWNYYNFTNFYDEPCDMVNGSAGELFPPNQTKEKAIEFYSADLCRSLKLTFKEEEVIHGITGYKYTGNEYTFDNGTLDPSNECFCNGACSPAGVLNVTSCRYGAPGFVSFPHFYLADKFYLDQVEGMRPDAAKHTLFITLQPETGIPLDVAARFQINILLSPIEKFSLFKNVPTIYFPMIWFEQRATITSRLAWQVKFALAAPLIGQIVSFLFIVGGVAVMAYYLYLIVPYSRRSKETIIDLKEGPIIKPLIHSDRPIQIATMQELLPKTMNGVRIDEKLEC